MGKKKKDRKNTQEFTLSASETSSTSNNEKKDFLSLESDNTQRQKERWKEKKKQTTSQNHVRNRHFLHLPMKQKHE